MWILCHFYSGDNFCDFIFAILYTRFLLKDIFSRKKEFAPKGKPSSRGRQNQFDRNVSKQFISCMLNIFSLHLDKPASNVACIDNFRNRLASGTSEKIQLSSLIAAFQVARDLIVDEAKDEDVS